MKIITFSDLHLEFGTDFMPPADSDADLMILAGDICTFADLSPLTRFLSGWKKPVVYIPGNHEYYGSGPFTAAREDAFDILREEFPNVRTLHDEGTEIGGVHIFGGTMWTDFRGANPLAMLAAKEAMNDYAMIEWDDGRMMTPADTVKMHAAFMRRLAEWFDCRFPDDGPRVVVTHHAPAPNPNGKRTYARQTLDAAYMATDAIDVILDREPAFWIYGHTHECDRQTIGDTLVLSNQRGYPRRGGAETECAGFDPRGLELEICA